MPLMRRHQRIKDTQDLSARLPSTGNTRVLNLSEGGMLIAASELEVGEVASFEFAGPDFRSAVLCEVAHRTEEATGLRFIRWDAPARHEIRNLIGARIRKQHIESAARSVPGCYLG
jgi:hypothetical protein